MNQKVEYFTWDEMDRLHRQIAQKIKQSKYSPNIIIGVLRCGLVPATHLSYLLNIDDVGLIKIRTTPNDDILVKKDMKPMVEFTLPQYKIEKRNILLIDTVMASGNTICLALDNLNIFMPKKIKVAIVVDWPNSPYKIMHGFKRPKIDYIGTDCKLWPDFPWEN